MCGMERQPSYKEKGAAFNTGCCSCWTINKSVAPRPGSSLSYTPRWSWWWSVAASGSKLHPSYRTTHSPGQRRWAALHISIDIFSWIVRQTVEEPTAWRNCRPAERKIGGEGLNALIVCILLLLPCTVIVMDKGLFFCSPPNLQRFDQQLGSRLTFRFIVAKGSWCRNVPRVTRVALPKQHQRRCRTEISSSFSIATLSATASLESAPAVHLRQQTQVSTPLTSITSCSGPHWTQTYACVRGCRAVNGDFNWKLLRPSHPLAMTFVGGTFCLAESFSPSFRAQKQKQERCPTDHRQKWLILPLFRGKNDFGGTKNNVTKYGPSFCKFLSPLFFAFHPTRPARGMPFRWTGGTNLYSRSTLLPKILHALPPPLCKLNILPMIWNHPYQRLLWSLHCLPSEVGSESGLIGTGDRV